MNGWPESYGRFVLPSVSSTLDEAASMAREMPAPFWLLANAQTAARGRRGRAWKMPAGNFAATLALRPLGTPAQAAQRSFVMSLALYQAFVSVTGQTDAFALKWPNDVLLHGGKVAGILLEGGRDDLLLIGVGINLAEAPTTAELEDGAVRPVSINEALSVSVTPERFLYVLAMHYAELEAQFETYGFAPIRTGWLAHAARLGEVVTARTGTDTFEGIFEDVDDEGQLVLRGPRGRRKIAAADVYF